MIHMLPRASMFFATCKQVFHRTLPRQRPAQCGHDGRYGDGNPAGAGARDGDGTTGGGGGENDANRALVGVTRTRASAVTTP